MIKVRGVYDGEKVRLLEQVEILPDTEVEVLVPNQYLVKDPSTPNPDSEAQHEEEFLRDLAERGIIARAKRPEEWDDSFEPIPNPGEPISDTIIRERR
jgi:hypothetical protein